MEKSMRDIILQAAGEMSKSCQSMDFIVSKGERRLPDKGSVIRIVKGLRRTIFPGFFGDENITILSPDFFIGDYLTHVYGELKAQISSALYYRDYDDKTMDQIRREADYICAVFFQKLPWIQQMLMKDVQAGFDGDPAAKGREDVIVSYPGLFAIYVYRIAHVFYELDVPFIPRIMTEYAHSRTGIDINPGAVIGEYFFIDHGTGVVIGETTEIGDYVKLYQGVTLGALSTRKGQDLSGKKRHPTIGHHVTIYSNATVLGGETVIGEGSIVAGGAFVTKSVPPYSRVSVKNPELRIKDSDTRIELQTTENKEGLWEI
ncbi:MAG: serine acetyltransferase [Eubacterium sp.]|nr:serine acetyltransferase [Eubacterium sp.]